MIDQYINNPSVVFEIGVGPVHSSRSRKYWATSECHLFEPVKFFYNGIYDEVSTYPNVHAHNVAICDKNADLTFWLSDAESSIEGINSPLAQQNLVPLSKVPPQLTTVEGKLITEFDTGNIDLLLLDMEGAEWLALKHMISRPRVIVVEMAVENPAFNGGYYRNPYKIEINKWMIDNHYDVFWEFDADVYWYKTK